jgi:hypothetical protein
VDFGLKYLRLKSEAAIDVVTTILLQDRYCILKCTVLCLERVDTDDILMFDKIICTALYQLLYRMKLTLIDLSNERS